MEFDDLLRHVGEFGKYQQRHYTLVMMIGVFLAFSTMGYMFIAAVPDHWCTIPDALTNLSLDEQKEIAIPKDSGGLYSKCFKYDLSRVNTSVLNISLTANDPFGYNVDVNVSELPVLSCTSWQYDTQYYGNTIVTQWDLVCDNQWIATTTAACVGGGKMIGSLIFGTLSDKYGRKRILVVSSSIACIVGILGAFSPHIAVYTVAVLIVNAGMIGALQCSFLLGLEMVGVSWREFAGSAFNWFWSAGFLTLPGIAYLVRDWSSLQLILFAPMLLFVALVIWLTPESPRWLLGKNRMDETVAILKNMASTNGVVYDEKAFELQRKTTDEGQPNVTLSSLTKSDNMVVFTMISCLLWFSVNLLFYGLSYNTSSLSGDPYVNFTISGAVEVPAYLCTWLMLRSRLGRRWSVFGGFIVGAVALFITISIGADHGWLVTTFTMIGKFAITSVFGMVFIYTPELYPTAYRTVGFGLSSTCSRAGLMVAPYMALLGRISSPVVPLIIFGVSALLSALATLLLPETHGVPLPDTLEDLRNFEKHVLPCVRNKCKDGATEVSMDDDALELDNLLGLTVPART